MNEAKVREVLKRLPLVHGDLRRDCPVCRKGGRIDQALVSLKELEPKVEEIEKIVLTFLVSKISWDDMYDRVNKGDMPLNKVDREKLAKAIIQYLNRGR